MSQLQLFGCVADGQRPQRAAQLEYLHWELPAEVGALGRGTAICVADGAVARACGSLLPAKQNRFL